MRERAGPRRGASCSRRCGLRVSTNNFIQVGYRLYEPEIPWAWSHALYWRKRLRRVWGRGCFPWCGTRRSWR